MSTSSPWIWHRSVCVQIPAVFPSSPPEPNTTTTWSGRDVLWLGPDEWLVVGEAGTEGSIERELGT